MGDLKGAIKEWRKAAELGDEDAKTIIQKYEKRIIMATFDEFYTSLDPDIGIRGKQFEIFIKWFLKTDPTWASQIDKIWLWNEYPKRWSRLRNRFNLYS